ncbi:MAG: RluA family pseudouridine synthase [Candidatus Margulisiibacteriota bacterium]
MANEFVYIISSEQKAERLDHFLAVQKEIALSRSQIHRLIDDGFVEVNKEIHKASYKLKPADRVVVRIPPPKKLEVEAENIPLDVVYEDEDLIVVNKPRGMVTHAAVGHYSGTLVNALLYHCKDLSGIGGDLRPGIVHRLDKDTSGLIVVAKSNLGHQSLAKQFMTRKVFKQYLALVHGVPKDEEGVIEAKIGRHPVQRKKMAVIGNGDQGLGGRAREAVTYYKVSEKFKNYSLIEVTLGTGRTHQIRVHLTSLGHSIVGDPTYGHKKEEFKVNGQLLHAAKLGFFHPRTGEHLEFAKEMPKDMQEIVSRLRKMPGSSGSKAGQ